MIKNNSSVGLVTISLTYSFDDFTTSFFISRVHDVALKKSIGRGFAEGLRDFFFQAS